LFCETLCLCQRPVVEVHVSLHRRDVCVAQAAGTLRVPLRRDESASPDWFAGYALIVERAADGTQSVPAGRSRPPGGTSGEVPDRKPLEASIEHGGQAARRRPVDVTTRRRVGGN
jgi:hypothetical protein